MKDIRTIIISVLLICAIIIALPGLSDITHADTYYSSPDFYAAVDSSEGEIYYRSGAGTEYAVLSMVPNGTVLHITDILYHPSDGFFWGQTFYAGCNGWISLRQTDILRGNGYQAPDYYAVTSADGGSVNFRSGPGMSYFAYFEIPNGQQLHITDMVYNPDDGFFWGQTSYNGNTGYVSLRQTTVMRGYSTYGSDNYYLQTGDTFINNNSTQAYNSQSAYYQASVYDTGWEGLALKASPNVNSMWYLMIPENTVITISQLSGNGWGYTSYNGYTGWVALKYTRIIGDYGSEFPSYGYIEPVYYTVYNTEGEGLELRSSPTVESSTFGPVYDGTSVLVQAMEGDWAYIYYNGHYGWCNLHYMRVSDIQASTPVAAQPAVESYFYEPDLVVDTPWVQSIEDILDTYESQKAGNSISSDKWTEAYIQLLQNNKTYIDGYNWQKGYPGYSNMMSDPISRPVAIQDIYGDEIPEIIYIMQSPDNLSGSDLHIVTFVNGRTEEIYKSGWHYQAAGENHYYLFQQYGDKGLYAYETSSDDFWMQQYYGFSKEGSFDARKLYERYEETSYQTGEALVSCESLGNPISEAEYNEADNNYHINTERILMYSANCGEFAEQYIAKNGCGAMTCDEAISYLTSIEPNTTENNDIWNRTMEKGMSGEDVLWLQQQLYGLGYLTVEPDGIFGGLTEAAVNEFQIANGLGYSDGKAGNWTKEKLNNNPIAKQGNSNYSGYEGTAVDAPYGAFWKNAYGTVLNEMNKRANSSENNDPDYAFYFLYDMDEDNIPELFAYDGNYISAFGYVAVYRCLDNSAVECGRAGGVPGYYMLYGIADQPGIMLLFEKQGYWEVDILTLSGNEVVTNVIGSGGSMYDTTYPFEDADFIEPEHFKLNDLSGLNWSGNPDDDNLAIYYAYDLQ